MSTNESFDIPSLPLPPDEDPIAELIGKRVTEMSDAELDDYVKQMRQVTQAPQSMKALLKNQKSVKTKAEKKSKDSAQSLMNLLGL